MEKIPFKNEPLSDFSEAHHREAIAEALSWVENDIRGGKLKAFPQVGGAVISEGEKFVRNDPSDNREVIGETIFASQKLAEHAIRTMHAGFPDWRDTPVETRIQIIRKVSNIMRERRSFLTALMIREAGKPWKEADADVAEAIDFCDYYAAHMEILSKPFLTEEVLGESNHYFYEPRGVAVVISPWNFPLAIACGMTVAALVTGNTTILKPAEQTSIIAAKFAEILFEAGVPSTAFAFLPGRGEIVGRHMVEHPLTALIAFTGSKPVGLEIIKTAAILREGQHHVKRVIAEMGGKNAIIIDDDADMDDAVRGVLYSAFGFSGQKCSACSRVIVVGDMYEPFVTRLGAAAADIFVGRASDPSTLVGPVIDSEARNKILETIRVGCDALKVLHKSNLDEALNSSGEFVPPTIFRDVPLEHPIWREEIFGPVLACRQAANLDEALKIANDSQYALTGGLFSRSPSNIEKVKANFRVGNLYINRSCTGALVARQPFGGFKLSGIGSKAGGKDYLYQFLEPRVVSENTMRRGFTPDLGL